MLTLLLILGVFGAGHGGGGGSDTGAIIATPARTAKFPIVSSGVAPGPGLPNGAIIYDQAFDPADHAPYADDFSLHLPGNEKIATIDEIAMSAAASMLGVSVDLTAGYSPIIDEAAGKKVQFWPIVDPTYWNGASFLANGVMLPVTIRISTDSVPPKRYERTSVLRVLQQ